MHVCNLYFVLRTLYKKLRRVLQPDRSRGEKRKKHPGYNPHLFKCYWHFQSQRNGKGDAYFLQFVSIIQVHPRAGRSLCQQGTGFSKTDYLRSIDGYIGMYLGTYFHYLFYYSMLIANLHEALVSIYFNEQSLGKHASDEPKPLAKKKVTLGSLVASQMTGPRGFRVSPMSHGLSHGLEGLQYTPDGGSVGKAIRPWKTRKRITYCSCTRD